MLVHVTKFCKLYLVISNRYTVYNIVTLYQEGVQPEGDQYRGQNM